MPYRMTSLLTYLPLCLLIVGFATADSCTEVSEDDQVYTFSIQESNVKAYSYVNEEGEFGGMHVDLVRYICSMMNKKCVMIRDVEHSCWDNEKKSIPLHNRWSDVCLAMLQSPERLASMGFVGEFAKEPASFIYVKKGSDLTTIDDIKKSSNSIGFMGGWYISPQCLEKYLGVSLENRRNDGFHSYPSLADAVETGQVEAMFMISDVVQDDPRFVRVDDESISCARGGFSMMVRKDRVQEFTWINDGLQKLRDNGDYKWLCNIVKNAGTDPGCF